MERAKHYAAGLTGGVGAYTNSQGIPAVREVHVAFSTAVVVFQTVLRGYMWERGGFYSLDLLSAKRTRRTTLSWWCSITCRRV